MNNGGSSTGDAPFDAATHLMELQLKRLDDPSTKVVNFHLAFQIKTRTGRSAGLKFMREYVL